MRTRAKAAKEKMKQNNSIDSRERIKYRCILYMLWKNDSGANVAGEKIFVNDGKRVSLHIAD